MALHISRALLTFRHSRTPTFPSPLRCGALTFPRLRDAGLGSFGVGYYQLVFTYYGNRALVVATIPMRLLFAGLMASWGKGFGGVVAYELSVALLCGVAAFA